MNSTMNKAILVLCLVIGISSTIMFSKYYAINVLAIKPRESYGNTKDNTIWQHQRVNLSFCPDVPAGLRSNVQPEERFKAFKDDPSVLQHVQLGGSYKPHDCRAKQHTAIVIPYRADKHIFTDIQMDSAKTVYIPSGGQTTRPKDRQENLRQFLIHIHQFLKKQQLHYRVFVAEMTNSTTFNTGMMQNIGFVTADKADNFTCFIIHDVDLLPTNEHHFYKCDDKMVVHLAPNNSKYGYKKKYSGYLGGAVAVTRDQFYKTNGYSNLYFGWGGQDDDFQTRVSHLKIKIKRVPMSTGIVRALPHGSDKGNRLNPKRFAALTKALTRNDKDGLNSLQYKVIKHELKDLYTWILVEIDRQQVMKGWEAFNSSHK